MNPAKGFSSNPKEKKNPGVFKRRSGLMKAFIGSNHIVQHEKRNMQFHVKEYSRHPDANVEVICLNCCKKYESYEAMRTAHPSDEAMEKREEPHVYALWSDDPIVVEDPVKGPDGKVIKQRVPPTNIIGLLSDEWPPS